MLLIHPVNDLARFNFKLDESISLISRRAQHIPNAERQDDIFTFYCTNNIVYSI